MLVPALVLVLVAALPRQGNLRLLVAKWSTAVWTERA
jgi:hypothetical protein